MAKNETIGLTDTHGLIGNPIEVFNKLGPDVQNWVVIIITLSALIFLVATLISIFGHGTGANVASITRNSTARTHHMQSIALGVVTVILVIIAVALVFAIYF